MNYCHYKSSKTSWISISCILGHRIFTVLNLTHQTSWAVSLEWAVDKPVFLIVVPLAFALDTGQCFGHPMHAHC